MSESEPAYALYVRRRVDKNLEKLPQEIQDRLNAAIDKLADEPRPPGSTPLKGTDSDWRIWVGRDYRVLYTIDDEAREVTVFKVGHRQGVYG